MKLLDIEKLYCKTYSKLYEDLYRIYHKIKNGPKGLFRGNNVTKAIYERMKTYYITQNKIKDLINKRYVTAGADFFVETIIFYLRLFLEKNKPHYEVHSERLIKKNKISLRPDISIWEGEKLIAIVECKTQLGWNRNAWEKDFKKREKQFKKINHTAKAYLLVLSLANWDGYTKKNRKFVGKKYFTLFKEWPNQISSNELDKNIITPIEILFKKI